MGSSLNKCTVINETGDPISIMTYSCSNIGYWFYRDWRQVPVQSEHGDQSGQVEVDGLPGGGAVYVAVMYNIKESTGRVVRDIFTVAHKATLTIQGITDDSGVIKYVRAEGVEMKTKGSVCTMSQEMSKWMAEKAKQNALPLLINCVIPYVGPLATWAKNKFRQILTQT